MSLLTRTNHRKSISFLVIFFHIFSYAHNMNTAIGVYGMQSSTIAYWKLFLIFYYIYGELDSFLKNMTNTRCENIFVKTSLKQSWERAGHQKCSQSGSEVFVLNVPRVMSVLILNVSQRARKQWRILFCINWKYIKLFKIVATAYYYYYIYKKGILNTTASPKVWHTLMKIHNAPRSCCSGKCS